MRICTAEAIGVGPTVDRVCCGGYMAHLKERQCACTERTIDDGRLLNVEPVLVGDAVVHESGFLPKTLYGVVCVTPAGPKFPL